MRATRVLMLCALCGGVLAGWPAAVNAQIYEAARQALDFAPDPIARSPRLLGMGRLELADDIHNGVDLWNFAGNPIGIFEADTTSSFDLRPETWSADGRHTPVGTTRERENLAGREMRVGYEAWKRSDNSIYGFYGDVADLRADRPFSDTRVLRDHSAMPRIVGVLNGRMPYFESERMLYELHALYSSEKNVEQYRTYFSNAEGDYLGRESIIEGPPNFFDPDQYRVSTLGEGAGISYRFAPWLTAALGGDAMSNHIEGDNSNPIHDTGTGENRRYYTGRLGLEGQVGKDFKYALDGKTWSSSAEERFVFTLKAGQNQDPFAGRGKMLDRTEHGGEGHARARWTLGKLELDAGANSWHRKLDIQPTVPGDPGSYNYFLDVAANRLGADSLALPDSIQRSHSDDKGWDVSYGATLKLGRSLVGAEYHFARTTLEQQIFQNPVATGGADPVAFLGQGPDRRISDVRAGLEYVCTKALIGRAGYIRRSDDHDELSQRNEFKSNTFTTGFGLHPEGATWLMDLGWAIEWIAPDYDDATDPKESRQQLAIQIHWAF